MIRKNFLGKFEGFDGPGRDNIRCTITVWRDVHQAIIRFMNGCNYGSENLNTFPPTAEQETAVKETIAFWSNPENKHRRFLWDCVPRFGKTLAAYWLVKAMGLKQVLILTRRPSDVFQQWQKELDHVDFDGWGFINCHDHKKPIELDLAKTNIVFLLKIFDITKQRFSKFNAYNFDLVIWA